MKILILGAGTVGYATGDGFARMGHDVVFYDKDPKKQDSIKGYTVFTEGDEVSLDDVSIVFICVEEWNVENVFEEWKEKIDGKLIVIRSTVFPGTTERMCKKYNFVVVHNPEFLRERDALHDFLYPSKIVIGRNPIFYHLDSFFTDLYKNFNTEIIFTDSDTSEFLKLANNAVLSSYISTWNQLFLIADKVGISSHEVAKILTLDPRISEYGTIHGKKYGGFCLPKDMDSLIKFARDLKAETVLLDAIKKINERMPD